MQENGNSKKRIRDRGLEYGSQDEEILEAAIIGAGFAGMAAAVQLKWDGIDNFAIFEKAAEVGGTWRDNVYPGVACDVKSNLYSYSFAPYAQWSHLYAKGDEIQKYLVDCSHHFKLRNHIHFHSHIVANEFDEEAGLWKISNSEGLQFKARVLILALGPLSRPFTPQIPGMESFQGKIIHSANWDHSYELKGKTVAVVGTGASAIQIVPSIINDVEKLTLFQRTAAWILPRGDREVTKIEKQLFRFFPFLQKIHRFFIYAFNETIAGPAVYGSDIFNRLAEWMGKKHLQKQVVDPALRKVLTPSYSIGCKRILLSDDYFPALCRKNCEVVPSPVRRIKGRTIVAEDGTEAEVDTLILCTGFVVSEMYEVMDMEISGRDGQSLRDTWRNQGMQGYRGCNISGFPNLFFYLGPNTGLGHNSMVHVMESQSNYLSDYMKILRSKNYTEYIDVKSEVQRAFNQKIQQRMKKTKWMTGCSSWYLNSKGENHVLWPGSTFKYRRITRRLNPNDYWFEPVKVREPVA